MLIFLRICGTPGRHFLFSSSVDRGEWPALFACFFPPGLYTKLGMVSGKMSTRIGGKTKAFPPIRVGNPPPGMFVCTLNLKQDSIFSLSFLWFSSLLAGVMGHKMHTFALLTGLLAWGWQIVGEWEANPPSPYQPEFTIIE